MMAATLVDSVTRKKEKTRCEAFPGVLDILIIVVLIILLESVLAGLVVLLESVLAGLVAPWEGKDVVLSSDCGVVGVVAEVFNIEVVKVGVVEVIFVILFKYVGAMHFLTGDL